MNIDREKGAMMRRVWWVFVLTGGCGGPTWPFNGGEGGGGECIASSF